MRAMLDDGESRAAGTTTRGILARLAGSAIGLIPGVGFAASTLGLSTIKEAQSKKTSPKLTAVEDQFAQPEDHSQLAQIAAHTATHMRQQREKRELQEQKLLLARSSSESVQTPGGGAAAASTSSGASHYFLGTSPIRPEPQPLREDLTRAPSYHDQDLLLPANGAPARTLSEAAFPRPDDAALMSMRGDHVMDADSSNALLNNVNAAGGRGQAQGDTTSGFSQGQVEAMMYLHQELQQQPRQHSQGHDNMPTGCSTTSRAAGPEVLVRHEGRFEHDPSMLQELSGAAAASRVLRDQHDFRSSGDDATSRADVGEEERRLLAAQLRIRHVYELKRLPGRGRPIELRNISTRAEGGGPSTAAVGQEVVEQGEGQQQQTTTQPPTDKLSLYHATSGQVEQDLRLQGMLKSDDSRGSTSSAHNASAANLLKMRRTSSTASAAEQDREQLQHPPLEQEQRHVHPLHFDPENRKTLRQKSGDHTMDDEDNKFVPWQTEFLERMRNQVLLSGGSPRSMHTAADILQQRLQLQQADDLQADLDLSQLSNLHLSSPPAPAGTSSRAVASSPAPAGTTSRAVAPVEQEEDEDPPAGVPDSPMIRQEHKMRRRQSGNLGEILRGQAVAEKTAREIKHVLQRSSSSSRLEAVGENGTERMDVFRDTAALPDEFALEQHPRSCTTAERMKMDDMISGAPGDLSGLIIPGGHRGTTGRAAAWIQQPVLPPDELQKELQEGQQTQGQELLLRESGRGFSADGRAARATSKDIQHDVEQVLDPNSTSQHQAFSYSGGALGAAAGPPTGLNRGSSQDAHAARDEPQKITDLTGDYRSTSGRGLVSQSNLLWARFSPDNCWRQIVESANQDPAGAPTSSAARAVEKKEDTQNKLQKPGLPKIFKTLTEENVKMWQEQMMKHSSSNSGRDDHDQYKEDQLQKQLWQYKQGAAGGNYGFLSGALHPEDHEDPWTAALFSEQQGLTPAQVGASGDDEHQQQEAQRDRATTRGETAGGLLKGSTVVGGAFAGTSSMQAPGAPAPPSAVPRAGSLSALARGGPLQHQQSRRDVALDPRIAFDTRIAEAARRGADHYAEAAAGAAAQLEQDDRLFPHDDHDSPERRQAVDPGRLSCISDRSRSARLRPVDLARGRGVPPGYPDPSPFLKSMSGCSPDMMHCTSMQGTPQQPDGARNKWSSEQGLQAGGLEGLLPFSLPSADTD
ncbi:unnamed protein product [Amoebophrya sp. A120]|nr:unnamed protein product [Amoebophrya sp. A120]|eukprot:GSA120T00014400001.1